MLKVANQVGDKLETMGRQMEDKLGAMGQQVDGQLGSLGQQMNETLGNMSRQMDETLGSMGQQMDSKTDDLNRQIVERLNGLDKQVGERLLVLDRQVGTTLEKIERQADAFQEPDDSKLTEKFATLEENVHKECVKVYRNVQAVVVEESSKQSEAVTGTLSNMGKMTGKTNAILAISIVAMITSLGSIILQLLQFLGK